MKIRTDFVTNSSSSSFIVLRKYVSDAQLELIKNHAPIIAQRGHKIPGLEYTHSRDMWDIRIETNDDGEEIVVGYTCMDNWGFEHYLAWVGLDMSLVKYVND